MDNQETYDYIVIGGGAAGLSFAYRSLQEPSLHGKRILIVDPDKKNHNDRTWSFWSDEPLWVDSLACRKWKNIIFRSQYHHQLYPLGMFDYRMVRGIDFYNYTHGIFKLHNNISFLHESVTAIVDGMEKAHIQTTGKNFYADFIFKGAFLPGEFKPDHNRNHYLKQHFKGWIIQSDKPVFDPDSVTMFDFSPPQNGVMRFIYILPFSANEALIEYTLFSEHLLTSDEYDAGLRDYISGQLSLSQYDIIETESGIIPMTDHPFPRKLGARILSIGTPAGLVKPSSGYAFRRILQDTEQVIGSLKRHGHPFDIKPSPYQYRFFDRTMLSVMKHNGSDMERIFSQMFKRNKIQRIFNFLDERDPIINNIPLLLSVSPFPFLAAVIRLYILGRI